VRFHDLRSYGENHRFLFYLFYYCRRIIIIMDDFGDYRFVLNVCRCLNNNYTFSDAVCTIAERRHAKSHPPYDLVRMRRRSWRHGKVRDAQRRPVLRYRYARRLEQVRVASGHVGDGFGWAVHAGAHRRANQRTRSVLYAGGALR